MFKFYAPLPYFVEFGGKRYKLTPAYNNVLDMYAALEGDFTDSEQIDIMMSFLFKGTPPRSIELLNEAIRVLFQSERAQKGQRCFDYIQDSEFIYAAFKQAYNIDLTKECGKMHWLCFVALLKGLPGNTKLSEIIQIRVKPLPKPTKYNAEERANLLRLKQQYALKISAKERHDNLQDGLAKMARCLISMAKNE